ncbi:MAG TPA: hypothetical protein VKZ52_11670 [Burkholderiaceae bacterium]|nr:hypothetical protein [Burkholderiaceae bacterium]
MKPISSLLCKAAVSLLLACGPALAVPQENWPVAPKLTELATPYGTLAVSESEYVYEARLKLDDTEIDPPIVGMLSISYAFELPDRQAALVAINSGNDSCPVSYRWVVLRAEGYQVSPAFGSCSEQIQVSADGRTLTLKTPSRTSPGRVDTYVFDGKTVKPAGERRDRRK